MKSLLSALAVGILFISSTIHANDPMEPSGVAQAMMSTDPEDFFETAASANMLEIKSGELAVQRAGDAAVKEFGARMVKDHTAASEKLEALAHKKGTTLPNKMLSRHQMMYDRLAEQDPGEDFDATFSNLMMMSHKEAVSLFDENARESEDADIRAFATEMLPTLQQHGSKAQLLNEKVDHQ